MAGTGNNRVIYSIQALGFAKNGESTFIPAHGVQNATITTNFSLEDVFELSQAQVYQIIEDLPDVQMTASKVLDGWPLLYHLATNGATSGTLQGRGNIQTIIALSLFKDTQDNASGTPVTQCECSGMFFNGATYTFPAEGNSTEENTYVGNNKVFRTAAFTFAGSTLNSIFNGNDAPAWGGGVVRRQHFDYGVSRLPTSLPGISSSGTNNSDADGNFATAVQNISVSFDLGRQNILELGHKGPYFKYPSPVIDVNTTFDIVNKSGDMVQATAAGILGNGNNLSNETIIIATKESTTINCGTRNKLQSTSINGGDTGGGIQTVSFSYIGKNVCTISHSSDPSGL